MKTVFNRMATLVVTFLSAIPPLAFAAEDVGEQVYEKWCSHCHGPESQNHPGTVALLTKYQGNLPADLRERQDLTEELISYYVRNGITIMPFFRKTEISDDELQALSAFIINFSE